MNCWATTLSAVFDYQNVTVDDELITLKSGSKAHLEVKDVPHIVLKLSDFHIKGLHDYI